MYRKLKKLNAETPTAFKKYLEIFPGLSEIGFNNVFVIPDSCTNDNKLKDFQFKILHRYLPTNSLLYIMKRIDSAKCTFCGLYRETIQHLFYDCLNVKSLLFRMQECFSRMSNCRITLSMKDVILGYKLSYYKDVSKFRRLTVFY